jgi:hypothetical protein
MKAVILDGSRKGENSLECVCRVLREELTRQGWEVESFPLREMEVRGCVGDFACWVQTPGTCLIDDPSRDVAKGIVQSDLVVLLTPVTFGGYSSELKKALDRAICNVSPHFIKIEGEVHHKPRYPQYPRLMGLGWLPGADEESEGIFKTLVSRNALNLHSPAHVADVLLSSEAQNRTREKIQVMLAALGVHE